MTALILVTYSDLGPDIDVFNAGPTVRSAYIHVLPTG